MITIKEMEVKGQLDSQSEERNVKKGFDMMMDMSSAAAQKAREIGSSNDVRVVNAIAAIYDFNTREIRLVYDY